MTNWAKADFTDILKNGSETCSNVIRVEEERLGLTIAAFNPLSCFGQADELADIKSSAGLPIWREDDPVHLTAAAYGNISAVISNQAETTSSQPTAGLARMRLASVVPAPTGAQPAIREPDWISGQLRHPLEEASAAASEAVTEVDSGEVGEAEPGEACETTHTSD